MARARKVSAKARRMSRTAAEEPQVATRTPRSLKRLKPDTPTGAGTRTDAQTMITSASKRRRPGEALPLVTSPLRPHLPLDELADEEKSDKSLEDAVERDGEVVQTEDPKSTSACPSPENSERLRRGHEAPQSRSSSIIETIFSPVFTLFGAKEGGAHSKTVSRVSSQGTVVHSRDAVVSTATSRATQAAQELGKPLAPGQRGKGLVEVLGKESAESAPEAAARGAGTGDGSEGSGEGGEDGENKITTIVEEEEEERSLVIVRGDGADAAVALECEDEDAACGEEGDDDDYDDFDPYLFIKRLPLLAECVPACRPVLLPKQTRRSPPITLVLDLDETLVHSTLDLCDDADFNFPVHFNGCKHTVYVRRRPHLQQFMERVAQLFEIIVFTASQSVYAETLLNILDPKRRLIRHRIFRESCVYVEGNYLKDLSVLGRDLAKTVIVDNSPQAFGFQVENGIPIESWFDDREDSALLMLLPFLESLVGVEDVRPLVLKEFNLREKIEAAQEPPEKGLGDPLLR